jgi:hypothetical protein
VTDDGRIESILAEDRRDRSVRRRTRVRLAAIRQKRLLAVFGTILIVCGPLLLYVAFRTAAENTRKQSVESRLEEMRERAQRGLPLEDPNRRVQSKDDDSMIAVLGTAGFLCLALGLGLVGAALRNRDRTPDPGRMDAHRERVARRLDRAAEESGQVRPARMRTEGKEWKCPNCGRSYSLHRRACPNCGMDRREARRRNPGRYALPESDWGSGGG